MFTTDKLEQQLKEHNYIPSKDLIYAVYSAFMLQKPLLIDGPPGVGKTELAKVLAKVLDDRLVRLQCYEGIDCSKVLYDYAYGKQLSYQNILKGMLDDLVVGKTFDEAVDIIEKETSFYDDRFIIKRPILEALIPNDEQRVLCLIDEIDKTDAEVEAMLLEPLSDYSMSIPERGTIYCKEGLKPFFVLTSNNQRELSEALRRRCIYVYIDYPSVEVEAEIIHRKANVDIDFAKQIALLVKDIRESVNLRQTPSTSESIEWANLLFNCMGIEDTTGANAEKLTQTLSCLLKNKGDLEKVKKFLEKRNSL